MDKMQVATCNQQFVDRSTTDVCCVMLVMLLSSFEGLFVVCILQKIYYDIYCECHSIPWVAAQAVR